MTAFHRRRGRAQGVALLAVLWIVSALTILTAGIVGAQRTEIRTAGTGRALVESTAIGRAAIQQVLQNAAATSRWPDRLQRLPVAYAGRDVLVEVLPLSGLIDLNTASRLLLAALLVQAAGFSADQAAQVAAQIDARRAPRPFDVPEDIAQVEGVGYEVYARIRDHVATETRSAGKVNPLAAPLRVLLVLARGDAAVAERIAQDRDAGAPAVDTTRLEAAFVDAAVGGRYRLTARVPAPDGRAYEVVADVVRGNAAAPWRILQQHAQLAPER